MKRCPECRRDYYDDTLVYCLDDCNALVEGCARVPARMIRTDSLRQMVAFIFVVSLLAISIPGVAAQTTPEYKNASLPVERRVDDLVGRMTLEEKASQMMNSAAAIPRLGIPEYNWWNEALHGVARAGTATVFPQAIGLAATFDER